MAKQKGRAILIKISDGNPSNETYSNVCGLRSKTFTINNAGIDVTTPDCTNPSGPLWAETMSGIKSLTIAGDGFFEDHTADTMMNDLAMHDEPVRNFQFHVPEFGTYTGKFRLTSLEFGGESEGGVTYSISLESTGRVTFVSTSGKILNVYDVPADTLQDFEGNALAAGYYAIDETHDEATAVQFYDADGAWIVSGDGTPTDLLTLSDYSSIPKVGKFNTTGT